MADLTARPGSAPVSAGGRVELAADVEAELTAGVERWAAGITALRPDTGLFVRFGPGAVDRDAAAGHRPGALPWRRAAIDPVTVDLGTPPDLERDLRIDLGTDQVDSGHEGTDHRGVGPVAGPGDGDGGDAGRADLLHVVIDAFAGERAVRRERLGSLWRSVAPDRFLALTFPAVGGGVDLDDLTTDLVDATAGRVVTEHLEVRPPSADGEHWVTLIVRRLR